MKRANLSGSTESAASGPRTRAAGDSAGPGPLPAPSSLFEPHVWSWFCRRFGAPTPPQAASWPRIAGGRHTLIFSPTGSGKTLAAFLWCLNELYRLGRAGQLEDSVYVLYVSPLRALNNDIQRNLTEPLEGIAAAAAAAGLDLPEVRSEVRTGDTSAAKRAAMAGRPPHILITTPESLFIILSTQRFRFALQTVQFVIVDEIHSVCDNKRGVHLSLSLERLRHLADDGFVRIGLSATQKPLDRIAAFLTGLEEDGAPRPCEVVDIGARRDLDVQVVTPVDDLLEAHFDAIYASTYDRLLSLIRDHDTTLVFTNSRYKTERTAVRLNELAADGDLRVGAHHGSMSRRVRLDMEERLKRGRLDGLVATSSLELGIDVGSIDLVCQLESPGSVSRGLQRIGRAGHLLGATSKGRLLVIDRDDLVEAAVLVRAILDGDIDTTAIPTGCLDVLAQHVVGAVAADEWPAADLYRLCRGSYCYGDLSRAAFDRVLAMLSGHYRFDSERDPYPRLTWDRVGDRLTPERGARVIAFRSSGTIPDEADYDVYLVEKKTRVGTLDEDFVEDLRHGDVFVLGSSSWRVTGFQRNRVLVEDVYGRPPTIPFWHGNARSRPVDLGRLVGRFRHELAAHLEAGDAEAWLQREYPLDANGVRALCEYFRQQVLVAGAVPSDRLLLVEPFRNELGQEQVVVHSCFGGRLNRTWAAALCHVLEERHGASFQRAVVDDGILLTIPAAAGLAAADLAAALPGLVPVEGLEELLTAAVLQSPAFNSRFRHNAVRSLQVLREYQGRRTPVWIQSARAADLLESCRDRLDYPVVAETLRECRDDDLDVPGLGRLLAAIRGGEVKTRVLATDVPSPFSHTLLLLGQYYEQGANPTRERRSRLVHLHREVLRQVLDEESLAALLDDEAAGFVESKLQYSHPHRRARTADELARALQDLGDLVLAEGEALSVADRVAAGAGDLLGQLAAARRVVEVSLPTLESHPRRWIAVDLFGLYRAAFRRDVDMDAEDARLLAAVERWGPLTAEELHERAPLPPRARDAEPDLELEGSGGAPRPGAPRRQRGLRALERRLDLLVDAYRLLRLPASGPRPEGPAAPQYASVTAWIPPHLLDGPSERGQARTELVLRHLRRSGPVTKYEIMDRYGFSERFTEEVLAALVAGGAVVRGEYVAGKAFPQFCYRANLEEIHRRTLERLRRELEPATADEYGDFLLRWQHVHPDTRLAGAEGLAAVIAQLQGLESFQRVYERDVFPARVEGYDPTHLDRLCYGGEVVWRRFDPSRFKRGYIGFARRRDLAWLVPDPAALDWDPARWDEDIPEACAAVRAHLAARGTCFFDDLVGDTGLEEGLALRAIWHLVWTGEATSDSYESIRHADIGSGLSGCYDLATRPGRRGVTLERIVAHMGRRRLDPRLGRWVATERLRPGAAGHAPPDERARQWALLLLARWGLACRDVLQLEACAPPWRDVVRALKRLELTGKVQRGYFVDGLAGEQYAAPEAVEALRAAKLRRLPPQDEEVGTGQGAEPEAHRAPPLHGPVGRRPLVRLNLCDPAIPFGTLLPLATELGEDVRQRLRFLRTPFKHLILRQGQPVLLYDRNGSVTVLAGLDRDEAAAAVGLLTGLADPAEPQPDGRLTRVTEWNGHPIDVSPARHLLAHLGFRPDGGSRGGLVWDGAALEQGGGASEAAAVPARFECLGREQAPVAYDEDWVVARSPAAVRDTVRQLIARLGAILPDTCAFEYGPRGFAVRYRGVRCVSPHIQQKKVNLHVTHRGWVRPIAVGPRTDLQDPAFSEAVLRQFERSRQAIDAQLDRGPGQKRGRAADPI